MHGIVQARALQWVAVFPPPGHLPDPEIRAAALGLAGDSCVTWEASLLVGLSFPEPSPCPFLFHSGQIHFSEASFITSSLFKEKTHWFLGVQS